jgi:hypothetical protein
VAESGTISVITLDCFLYSFMYIINNDGIAGNLNCRVLGLSVGVTVRTLCYLLQAGGFLPL